MMSNAFHIQTACINNDFIAGQATIENQAQVIALLVKTAEWLKSNGSSQWSALLEGNSRSN